MEDTDKEEENIPPEEETIHNAKFYPDFSRKFVCIQYPGIVQNVDRMIETLGGIENIETVVGATNKKLELRFHPDNFYSKPCYADRHYKPGVLLKVKIRHPKADVGVQNEEGSSVVDYEVAGVTAMGFKFNRLCDFQLLPLVSQQPFLETSDSRLEYIYNKIVPEKLPDANWLFSEKSLEMPYFLPPQIFSRFDSPNCKLHFEKSEIYKSTFRPEFGERIQAMAEERRKKRGEPIQMQELPYRTKRKPRKVASLFVNFDAPKIPVEPPPRAAELLSSKAVRFIPTDKIKQLFEERPIWSKAGLCHQSGIDIRYLKYILPSYAYYYHTGPWRVMWVKYGYDPRKDPAARIYQTFDFRVRLAAGSRIKVQAKRTLPNDPLSYNVKKFSLKGNLKEKQPKTDFGESTYVLRPGMIPAARQMFYQYCDIYLPEIVSMLARLPDVPPGAKCDAKNGWLPDKFHDQCREIATIYISEEVQKQLFQDKLDKAAEDEGDSDDDVQIVEEDEEEFLESEDETLPKQTKIKQILDDDDDSEEENEDQATEVDLEDTEIDMEAVDEINKIIADTKNQDEVAAGPSTSFSHLKLY